MTVVPQDRAQYDRAANPRDSARFARWQVAGGKVDYPDAVKEMEATAAAIRTGEETQRIWLLEHPPLYTAGTSAQDSDLLTPDRFPVYRSGRGGQYTYHGPGQRVAYVMLDLQARGADLRAYIRDLEEWIIRTLACFGVAGERRPGRVGIWIDRERLGGETGREDKIAAIGVRVRRWVSFHGIAINVDPDLSHFEGIVPCGIRGHRVTSLADLGLAASMAEADEALRQSFEEVFEISTR